MHSVLDWLQHNKEWVFSGAGITILTLLLSLLRARSSPRRDASLQINVALGWLTYGPGTELSDDMLLFTVANPSERPVQLTGIRIPIKGHGNMVFPRIDGERRLPCIIEAGTNVKFWVPLSHVRASIDRSKPIGQMKVRAIASDALGRDYVSNPVKV